MSRYPYRYRTDTGPAGPADGAFQRMSETSLYIVQSEAGPVKIGIAKDPKRRLGKLQTGNPHKLHLLFSVQMALPLAVDMERGIHGKLKSYGMKGEWFDTTVEKAYEVYCMELLWQYAEEGHEWLFDYYEPADESVSEGAVSH